MGKRGSSQVQQQLAVLGKNKGFLVGFVDNRFTRVYEIERNDKLISLAYELTKRFQKCLDENIEPELNGCPAECEFLKQEFQGFENKYEKIPLIKIEDKEMEAYFSMNDTKKLISKEIKDIDTDLDLTKAKIQKKMIELETESLLINGRYLATWKVDSRGAKRFNLKELPENKIIKEVA